MRPQPGLDPDAGVRVGETGPIGRHEEIAVEREFEAAGDRGAVDRTDDRLADAGERTVRLRRRFGDASTATVVAAELLQVESRAERRIGAGDDDDPYVVSCVAFLHDAGQRAQHLARKRVAGFGTIQRDGR